MNTIEVDGLTFKVEVPYDETMGEPWKEHDGHGIVSEWRHYVDDGYPGKAPGERLLRRDRGSARFYDFAGTMAKAREEGWGCDEAKLEAKLGRKPTKKEIIVEAVEQDFQRLRAWCNDEWRWCGIVVTLLDIHGRPTDEERSLWGIDGDDQMAYIDEEAHSLAKEISRSVGGATTVAARPSEYTIRSAA